MSYLIRTLNKNYQGHEIKYHDVNDSCHVQQKKGNAYKLKQQEHLENLDVDGAEY